MDGFGEFITLFIITADLFLRPLLIVLDFFPIFRMGVFFLSQTFDLFESTRRLMLFIFISSCVFGQLMIVLRGFYLKIYFSLLLLSPRSTTWVRCFFL